jgi:hypothetical protein
MPSQRHKRIVLSQPINPGSYGGPSQESRRRKDEDHDHGLVFQGVALYATTVSIHPPAEWWGFGGERTETRCENIIIPRILAYR